MIYSIVTVLIACLASGVALSQSFIDPYKYYRNAHIELDIPTLVGSSTNPNNLIYPIDEPNGISGGYTGEYMICLDDHFWQVDPDFQDNAKSYKVEIVSVSTYNSEYMIHFGELWWFKNYPAGGGNFEIQRLQQEKY